jgi:hypothetical protein
MNVFSCDVSDITRVRAFEKFWKPVEACEVECKKI